MKNKYNLIILPIAKNDMENIIFYVSKIIKNNSSAIKISKSFEKGLNIILKFPYGNPIYNINQKNKKEYRCLKIKNYLMFYFINNNNIIIARVLYSKMNIEYYID